MNGALGRLIAAIKARKRADLVLPPVTVLMAAREVARQPAVMAEAVEKYPVELLAVAVAEIDGLADVTRRAAESLRRELMAEDLRHLAVCAQTGEHVACEYGTQRTGKQRNLEH